MGLFDDLTRQASNLNNVSVEVSSTDTVDSVARKLKAELKRQNALELSDAELRDFARDFIKEARR